MKSNTISIKPVFVKTANVREFESAMHGLTMTEGEGRFAVIWGRAGRGKTRTAQYWCANTKGCHYVLALQVWRHSQAEMLRAIAKELGIVTPPHRIGPLFAEIAQRLIADGRPIFFVDEPDKLSLKHLEIIRDLTESTGAPFVLIGEEQLPDLMRKERRIWSRTYQQVQFKPFGVADIVQYVTTAAGIRFTSQAAAEAIYRKSEGDIRLVKIISTNLVQALNAKGTAEADEQTVAAAIRQAFPS